MRIWLRPLLDRFAVGLVPIDGDFGRRGTAAEDRNDRCRAVQAARLGVRPRVEEPAWIPSTILFGPPL